MLDFNEYVAIEDKKDELFFNRMDYIAMTVCFKTNMERGNNSKQIKAHLREWITSQ